MCSLRRDHDRVLVTASAGPVGDHSAAATSRDRPELLHPFPAVSVLIHTALLQGWQMQQTQSCSVIFGQRDFAKPVKVPEKQKPVSFLQQVQLSPPESRHKHIRDFRQNRCAAGFCSGSLQLHLLRPWLNSPHVACDHNADLLWWQMESRSQSR